MKKGRLLILAITLLAVVGLLGACTGDIGPAGSVGPQGVVGEQGPQGEVGSQGLTGETGLQGEPGLQGIAGLQGSPGADGVDGSDGAPGTPGATGATGGGSRGSTGATGADGVDADLEVLLALQSQIDVLGSRIVALVSPQMEEIYPLVLSTSNPNVLTDIVELVFDFSDVDDDLVELEIDFSADPYTQETKEQVAFFAIEGGTNPPEELALLAIMGIVPSYDASEQKWTIRIDTTTVQTQELIDIALSMPNRTTPWFPWAQNVNDPIFPEGLFHWYLEVVDEEGNLWGDMMAPPAYSHYVNSFLSVQ